MALAGKSRSSRAKSPFVKTTPAFNPMPTPPIVSGSPFTDYAPLARGLLSTLGKQSLQLSEVCLCLRALGWPSTEPRASLWQHAALAAEAAAEAVAASVRMNSSLHIDAAASAAVAASSALVRSPAGGAPPSVGAAGLQALLFVAATCTPPTRITMRDAFLFLAMEEESDESRMDDALAHAHTPGLVDFAGLQAALRLSGASGDSEAVIRELSRFAPTCDTDMPPHPSRPNGSAPIATSPLMPVLLTGAASVSPALRLNYEATLDIFAQLIESTSDPVRRSSLGGSLVGGGGAALLRRAAAAADARDAAEIAAAAEAAARGLLASVDSIPPPEISALRSPLALFATAAFARGELLLPTTFACEGSSDAALEELDAAVEIGSQGTGSALASLAAAIRGAAVGSGSGSVELNAERDATRLSEAHTRELEALDAAAADCDKRRLSMAASAAAAVHEAAAEISAAAATAAGYTAVATRVLREAARASSSLTATADATGVGSDTDTANANDTSKADAQISAAQYAAKPLRVLTMQLAKLHGGRRKQRDGRMSLDSSIANISDGGGMANNCVRACTSSTAAQHPEQSVRGALHERRLVVDERSSEHRRRASAGAAETWAALSAETGRRAIAADLRRCHSARRRACEEAEKLHLHANATISAQGRSAAAKATAEIAAARSGLAPCIGTPLTKNACRALQALRHAAAELSAGAVDSN